jgi:hypothetical protein
MTHLPDTAPTDGRPGPGNRGGSGDRKGGLRIAGVTVRFTIGGYLLAVLAAAVGAMILPAAAPGALTGVLTPADVARASQLGALHLGRPAR